MSPEPTRFRPDRFAERKVQRLQEVAKRLNFNFLKSIESPVV